MKVTLVHPYKHHSYNIVKAVKQLECELEVFYGYYNKNNNFYKFIKKYETNKNISKFLGYNCKDIDKYVRVNRVSNLLFLLSKIDSSKTSIFLEAFEKSTLKKVKDKDIYILLQDYCNNILEYAYLNNKFIIYDHIMPAGMEQRKLLLEEAIRYDFPVSYVDKFLSEKRVEQNYENIRKSNIILNASMSTYMITEEVLGKEKAIDKSFIIPYGVNFEYMNENDFSEYIEKKHTDIKRRMIKILYVGSISLAKGIGYLIDILEDLKDYDVEFGIVGVPNKEEDKILLEKLLKYENAIYHGSVPHKQIKEIYKQYDLFIFTSIIEGFGMVTLEAMSMGLPCIVNKYCSSIIQHNNTGFIVQNVDSKSYIKIIKEILNNPNMIKDISYRAYEESKNYSWDRYITKIKDIFINNVR